MVKLRHKLVFDIEQRFEQFSLNTVISGFMEYNNKLIDLAKKEGGIDKETLKTFTILLAPFAPHLGEELWQELGGTDSVFHASWPECDAEKMKDDEKEVAVQINGRVRATITVPADISKEDAIAAGKEAIKDKLTGNIVKEIYVPGTDCEYCYEINCEKSGRNQAGLLRLIRWTKKNASCVFREENTQGAVFLLLVS